MAEVMTYTSLQSDMKRYLERGASATDPEVFAQIPRLINLAERSLGRIIKVQGYINVVTADLVAGTSVYAKPDRWRQTVSMEAGSPRAPIFARDYEYCRRYWPDPSQRDVPEFYADYNYANWLIVPTPVVTLPWQIIYYEQPPYLDDTNQTNWLTDYAPNALLYRALLEATPFLKNDERIPTWKTFYDEAIASLDAEDIQKQLDRNAARTET